MSARGKELVRGLVGEVYGVREEIKRLGGRFEDGVWWVRADRYAEAQGIVDADQPRVWREYVDGLAWGKGSLAESSYAAGLRAASMGIDFAEAVREIYARRQAAGGTKPIAQTEREVRRAYDYAGKDVRGTGEVREVGGGGARPAAVVKPVYVPSKLEMFAGSWAKAVDVAWLIDRSPVDPRGVSPAGFLEWLYGPEERVVVFDVFESPGQWVWGKAVGMEATVVDYQAWDGQDPRHEAGPPVREGKAFTGKGPKGIWFLCNPVDGRFHQMLEEDKHGRRKWSRRAESAITSWRYFVLESDEADMRHWLGAVVQLPLPIAAMYLSGGKSVHVLVRVDASSKAEFDLWRQEAIRALVPIGADRGAMSGVRLSRLPGCWRMGEDGARPRLQRLLYLDPQAGFGRLADRAPVRDCVGPWERVVQAMEESDAAEVSAEEVEQARRGLEKLGNGERARGLRERLGRVWERVAS